MGLINYHALASRIKPTVDRITARDVNVNTIVVVIKRFSDAQSKLGLPPKMPVLNDAKMTLTSGVIDLTITPKRANFINELKRLVELSAKLEEHPDIFPLVNSIKIIADANDYGKLKAALKGQYSLKPRMNTSKLTIHLIEEVEKSPGIAAYITDLLYRNDINIVNLFLGYEEIIIILDESDGPRTYSILKDATGNQGFLN
jgi:hypothetical protein